MRPRLRKRPDNERGRAILKAILAEGEMEAYQRQQRPAGRISSRVHPAEYTQILPVRLLKETPAGKSSGAGESSALC